VEERREGGEIEERGDIKEQGGREGRKGGKQ
jgi:hypothetical protein